MAGQIRSIAILDAAIVIVSESTSVGRRQVIRVSIFDMGKGDQVRLHKVNDLLDGDQLIVKNPHEILWAWQSIKYDATSAVYFRFDDFDAEISIVRLDIADKFVESTLIRNNAKDLIEKLERAALELRELIGED
jgi:hypothetical protein